jgi:hypothetical protein
MRTGAVVRIDFYPTPNFHTNTYTYFNTNTHANPYSYTDPD